MAKRVSFAAVFIAADPYICWNGRVGAPPPFLITDRGPILFLIMAMIDMMINDGRFAMINMDNFAMIWMIYK